MSDQTDGNEPLHPESSEWEYNAPQEWIDFNSADAHNLNDQADNWFDEQVNAEENFYSIPDTFRGSSAGNNDGDESDKSVYYETDPTDSAEHEQPDNNEGSQPPPTKRIRRSTRVSAASVSSVTSTVSAPGAANIVTSWGDKSRKVYPTAEPSRLKRRSLQNARERMRPRTPAVLRRPQRVPAGKSSEQLELEKIEAARKRAQQMIKQSQKSLGASESCSRKRTYTATQPTQPEQFHFHTDQRLKSHGMKTRLDETLKPADFAKCLRSNKTLSNANSKPPRGPTVPKPFHLTHLPKKPSSAKNQPGYAFHSDAERIIKFQKDTPERFRTRPRNDPGPSQAEKQPPPKLTMPQTPNLVSRNRKRPISAISAAEKEEKEVEEIKRSQFRAQPVNSKIFEQETGIPKVEPKEVTKPIGFNLQTEKRPLVNRHAEEPEEKFEFKAHPLPRNILEGPVGVKKVESAPLTIPASPAFALKNRLRSVGPLNETEVEEVDRIVKAKPVPHLGLSFQPKLEHKATVPNPFSFDERDKHKLKEKEDKIKKVIEEESKPHDFHAQPVPNYDNLHEHIPKTKPKPPTKPEPFNLESVQRSQQKQEELDRLREEEMRELREAAQFKARPATVTTKDPFIPRRVEKPLTEINEFELNTERRAHEREVYEERKHERDVMLDEMNQARLKRQQEEEKQEVRELRQSMVHKAQPVKHFKPVSIHPSDRSLTQPQSPRFSDRIKK